MDRPFRAYKGDQPYIFVSYSHVDSSAVFNELLGLSESGFNIWYDEGIEAGTEWREELAKAIEEARLLLYFVTANSAQSQNCRKEVNFAIEQDIPVIAIHLEKTKLPSGLSLTLSDRQAILKHELPDQQYRDKLEGVLSRHVETTVKDNNPSSSETRSPETLQPKSNSIEDKGFQIEQIEQIPPPRRSFGKALIFVFFATLLGAVSGFTFALYAIDPPIYYLQPNEMVGTKAIVLALDRKESQELDSLLKGLDKQTRKLISDYVGNDADSESLGLIEHHLRKNLNSLIGSDVFLLGPLNPQWNDEIARLGSQFPESSEKSKTNRTVLDLIFKDELQRWTSPPDSLDALQRFQSYYHHESNPLEGLWLILLVALVFWSAYLYTLGCILITFKSANNVEGVLEYLVSEMGFRPPTKEKNVLIFRARLTTILLYTVLKLQVTIDGNRVLITAPLPITRRISKRLLSLSR